MRTKIEQVAGQKRLTVSYGGQKFFIDTITPRSEEELKLFKSLFDKMVVSYSVDLVHRFTKTVIKKPK